MELSIPLKISYDQIYRMRPVLFLASCFTLLNNTLSSRSRGITMDVGQSKFETTTKSVTLLDAPGHKDFIPNMITGATQADVALLVVDGTRGEFETGFESGGQTREHALLVRSLGMFQCNIYFMLLHFYVSTESLFTPILGVSQLGVVVNKLDTVSWSQERFQEITSKLSAFLRQAGFRESDVTYVPCSGLTGENMVVKPTAADLNSWYTGPCLLDVIGNFFGSSFVFTSSVLIMPLLFLVHQYLVLVCRWL